MQRELKRVLFFAMNLRISQKKQQFSRSIKYWHETCLYNIARWSRRNSKRIWKSFLSYTMKTKFLGGIIMSKIKNEVAITNDEKANVLRGAIWTRASWMGLFYDEACKAGFAKEMEDILRKAIYRFSLQQGQQMRESLLTQDGKLDMTRFPDKLLPPTSFVTFEAEKVNVENDRAEVTYHFCPLVKGWQDHGSQKKKNKNSEKRHK